MPSLCSNSVQEAADFALIAQAATLESRIPFLHFFDGFRTSHELNQIFPLSDDDLRALIDETLVRKHRERGLSPTIPFFAGLRRINQDKEVRRHCRVPVTSAQHAHQNGDAA
jgi:pyruvate/2-oxoacid:ferredoxin oxidoreductase alpha subunit